MVSNGVQLQEKAPFVAKADKRKKEYEKTLANYNKKKVITVLNHV